MTPAVEVEPDLRITFPHRSREFREGVEIGVLAALLATGAPVFDHPVSIANLDQARDLAAPMGYRAVLSGETDGLVTLRLTRTSQRPHLSLVAI